MALNWIGISLFALMIVSLLGLLIGFIAKRKNLMKISFIVLAAVIVFYLVLSFIF